MRLTLAALLLTTVAYPVAAGDGFGLDLDEEWLPFEVVEGSPVSSTPTDRMSLELDDTSREALVYANAVTPSSERELRQAFWNSDMGRLMYHRAASNSMLGREGLVGGGRMVGIGIAPTTVLGDGASSPLRQLFDRISWSELTLGEKAQSGLQAAFLAAFIHFMAENAD